MNCKEIVKHSCLRHIGEMSLYIYLIGQMVCHKLLFFLTLPLEDCDYWKG